MDFSKLDNRFIRHVNVPANMGVIEHPAGRAVGVGQCGDSVEVALRVNGERISEIRHLPRGCSFTIACASAMTELARNRTIEQALEITPQDVEAELGGLPEDHLHCARLAVNTLGEAIADCYRRQAASAVGPAAVSKEEKPSNAHIRQTTGTAPRFRRGFMPYPLSVKRRRWHGCRLGAARS
jgi:nitrogen fixation NifU-like protein